MSDPVPNATPLALQFDRAESIDASAPLAGGVVCATCKQTINDAYFTLGQKSFCASCKAAVDGVMARAQTQRIFGMAFAFGLAAAIAGAGIYYAVLAYAGVQLSLITVLIGYMVGRAIHKATYGGGGRRYQVLAVTLTYLAVGLSYLFVAMKAGAVLTGVSAIVLVLALPVMDVLASMPGGLLTAVIIGFGLRQAWRMTAAPNLAFTGPLKVAPPNP